MCVNSNCSNTRMYTQYQYRFFGKTTVNDHYRVTIVALFVVKYMKAFFRVLNTTSRLIATQYYARGDTSVALRALKVSLLRCRKTRQSDLLWILCGAIIPGVLDSSPSRSRILRKRAAFLLKIIQPLRFYRTFGFSNNQILRIIMLLKVIIS